LKEKVCEGARWIQHAQDKIHWQALVNIVMNFPGAQKAGFSSSAKQLSAYQTA
jgi:hypothetical protein